MGIYPHPTLVSVVDLQVITLLGRPSCLLIHFCGTFYRLLRSPVVKGIVAPKAVADKPSGLQFLKAFDGFRGCILDRLSSLSIALQTFVAERRQEAVYNLHTFIEYSYQSHKPRKILSGLLFQFTRKDVHGTLYNASLKH